MGKNHADQPPFRERLLRLLIEGRWAGKEGETHEETAYRLGVIPEVLAEAIRLRAAENKTKGQPPTGEYAVVEVTMPPKIDKHWRAICGVRREPSSTVLRSLIHHFLMSGGRPEKTGSAWVYEGERFKIGARGRKQAKTRITLGAQGALDHYARKWNVTCTGIVRGLIAGVLEARRLPDGMRLVAFGGLWGDTARYLEAARPAHESPRQRG